ncbi:MAG TPA: class I SAM-dependent methyltransferase [Virgibacillus sp.]|nr:class I SAM-dependent methyltransferase [Virgibacillus sp.]
MSKDQWDRSFSADEFVYGESENIFIHNMSPFIPAQSIVGCFAEGEGRNAVFLAKEGHDVTAYDQSSVGLEKAEELAYKHNVNIETVAMDLTKEHVSNNQYDAAIMVFGHVPKQDQPFFMENIIDSVKPGGHVLFEVYSEAQLDYQTGGPPSVDLLYHPETVLSWVNQYKCLHFYYGEAERHEGKRHHGRCHVIQVVIKK